MSDKEISIQNDSGHGGLRVRAGRPTDALKHKFQRILEDSNAYKRFLILLKNTDDNEIFLKAFQIALERGFGKAPQALTLPEGSGINLSVVLNLTEQMRIERGLDG